MLARGHFGTWAARGVLSLLAITLFSLFGASGAQAAAPARSLTPYLICYWDNGNNNTVTVSIGVRSTNAALVNVAVGNDNRITQGNPNRGQPTQFDPGTDPNVWAFTLTWAEVFNGIDWSLTGNSVSVATFTECASKPVPASGNGLAFLAFGAVVTVAGGFFLDRRVRSRRRVNEIA